MIRLSGRIESARAARGVTLIELVVVIALLGILAALGAVVIREPIRAYRDSLRRAELTDVADAALRRVASDIRLAVPNSVRISGAGPIYLELLATRTGGRYRASKNAAGTGDELELSAPTTSFDALGTTFDTLGPSALTGQAVAVNDMVVVFNVTSSAAVTEGNAYTVNTASCSGGPFSTSCNTARVTAVGAGSLANERKITFANRQFPFASPGNRFQIAEGPVTYECAPNPVLNANGDGVGTLRRVSGYTIALAQPTGTYAGAPTSGLLANNVTACDLTYDQAAVTQRFGLVSLRLELARGGERVSLYHEVHVSNVP